MFLLPGYIDYYEEHGVIYVSSKLRGNKIKLTDSTVQAEFKKIVRCGGCSDLRTPLTNFLHDQEMLLEPERITQALEEVKDLLNNSLLITIMPTEGCNFRCPYCYESHTPITMRRETLNQIKEYIAAQACNFDHINVSWFGGEPTLCKDVVLETSEFVQSLQARNDFVFTANMTTNGYLLTAEAFEQYYQAGITDYQITLDGWNHDTSRPHVSGKGTLDTILSNLLSISALPQENYHFRIILRHNILPENVDYSWYDYLHSKFGEDSRFSVLVRPVGDWGGESVKAVNVLKGEDRDTLVMKHIRYLQKIGMQCENGQKGIFAKICYASYPHSMVFRSSGIIEKCTVCLDHPKNLLGIVDTEQGVCMDDKINQLWCGSGLEEKCYQCGNVLSCVNMQCRKPEIIDGKAPAPCSFALQEIY